MKVLTSALDILKGFINGKAHHFSSMALTL